VKGHEHYIAAEQLLATARDVLLGSEEETYSLAAAQVHATLALAAATVAPFVGEFVELDETAAAWLEATT
jgi:hypothetical protein